MIKYNDFIYDIKQKFDREQFFEDVEIEFVGDCSPFEDEEGFELEERFFSAVHKGDEETVLDMADRLKEADVYLEHVRESDFVVNVLKEKGYKVESSSFSASIYAKNDNNEEVRISDHKRPPVIDGEIAYDHEYENEIIVDGIEVYSNTLIKHGFSKLEKNKTLYLYN